MASRIAWLDFSEEEQRKAREIVQLFSQQESRDELGIGTVRDALSDAMFPGMSTIQTRARYFLFVPWLFREGERRGYSGPALVRWVDTQERKLIEALRAGGEGAVGDGLIGRVAGVRIKNLPSTIYWNGMQRLGILRRGGGIEQVAGQMGTAKSLDDVATELVERADGVWDPTLPTPPQEFFRMESATFSLDRTEADWLAERIEASTDGSLLAWLAAGRQLSESTSASPWEEPAVSSAPPQIAEVLHHAEFFSHVMHGAALLYNLLLAERCGEIGLDIMSQRCDPLRSEIDEWRDQSNGYAGRLTSWDRSAFWGLLYGINPRIPVKTRLFVDEWITVGTSAQAVADDAAARRLIRDRERARKASQSRLVNDRLLRQWGGEAGLARLTYRWGVVRTILQDIESGRSAHVGA